MTVTPTFQNYTIFAGRPNMLSLEPPAPRAVPFTLERHDDHRTDDFYWFRDRDNPAVIAHLEAENAYARAVMAPERELEQALYHEMLGRIQETDLSVPVQRDDWLYFTRTEAGRQYPLLCRAPAAQPDDEAVLLDQNALAEGHPFYRLGDWAASPDHQLIAWLDDTEGNERFTLHVLDTATGTLLPERVTGLAPMVEWSADGTMLFYVALDDTERPWQLLRHRMGAPHRDDVVVFSEPDAGFYLAFGLQRSRRYFHLHLSSHSTSEVWLLDRSAPLSKPFVVEPRRQGIEYAVDHHGDRLFVVTNDGAVNFRLMETPVATPGHAHWQELIPGRDDVKLDGVEAFRDHLVIWERELATPQVTIRRLATGDSYRIDFPEAVYAVVPGNNPEFDTDTVRFTYTSMVTPASVIDYDMTHRRWTLRKQQPVLGGYDPAHYRTERVFADADDGARIPVSVVYRLPLEKNGGRPLLLSGYGSYGVTYDPTFSSNAVSLLNRGFVLGIAHIRGGEELGRAWYEGGKLLEKRNTFTDFIRAAETLIAGGWTASDRLMISGGSAGGLLMGAVTNLRPDLFRAVIAEVPFVDVVTTMLDESIPLTVLEYEEWGNPNQPEYYHYMKSYSPYDNVSRQPYPAMLVTAGLNDPRVSYWEPAKWVARLRQHSTSGEPILLKTNMGAGHGGASGRYDHLREVAFKWAFLLSRQ